MCKYYLENFRDYESETVKNSKPYWNGEDILFSLLSIKKYNNLPIAYNLSHDNRISNYFNFSNSISFNSGHKEYRDIISKEFLEKTKVKDQIISKTKIKNRKNDIIYFIQNSVVVYIIYFFIFLLILFFYKRLK